MSVTLNQAKISLARSVESGMLPSDPRVVDRINEAQARLHALGDWIGTVARYGVTVNQGTGIFSLPAGLQNIMRVSELPDGLSHSVSGTFLTDSEYAFVWDTASVLTVQPVSPTEWRVVGVAPAAVDVMGKKKFVVAVNDDDLLTIPDIESLKLMLLALHREENNRLELSTELVTNAVGHIKAKSDTAIGEARRLNYTSMLSSYGENTVGHARAQIALTVSDGIRLDDHKVLDLLNCAEERVMQKTRAWEPRLFKVKSGVFALPSQYESILKLDIDNVPQVIRAQWHEYDTSGLGYRESSYWGPSVIARGEHALHTDIPQNAIAPVVVTFGRETRVKVRIRGIDNHGIEQSETVLISGEGAFPCVNIYSDIYSVTKDPSAKAIAVLVGSVEVALIEAWQTDSRVTRYAIAGGFGDEEERIIRAVLRPKWYRKLRDSDMMQVHNLASITNMVISVLAERAGKVQEAELFEARSIGFFDEARVNKEASHAKRVSVQRAGWAMGSVRKML